LNISFYNGLNYFFQKAKFFFFCDLGMIFSCVFLPMMLATIGPLHDHGDHPIPPPLEDEEEEEFAKTIRSNFVVSFSKTK
jgi:hypothetical protein